jgi:predicted ABC-type ATPase
VKDGGFVRDNGTYTPEREALHKQLLDHIFSTPAIAAATPPAGQKPTAILFGGRPGSGKSLLTAKDGPLSIQNAIVLDPDHFKQQLPEYKGWNATLLHEESSHLTHLAANRAQALGLNVVFDQTMRTQSTPEGWIKQFEGTHDIHGVFLHTPPQEAAARALGRFAQTGRFVDPDFILGQRENEQNFDKLIPHMKTWRVYDNSGQGEHPYLYAKGGEDEFYYHVTDPANITSIRKEGLTGSRSGANFGFKTGQVHLATTLASAQEWEGMLKEKGRSGSLLLRVKARDVPDAVEAWTANEKHVSHVGPHQLEYYSKSKRSWQPLIKI